MKWGAGLGDLKYQKDIQFSCGEFDGKRRVIYRCGKSKCQPLSWLFFELFPFLEDHMNMVKYLNIPLLSVSHVSGTGKNLNSLLVDSPIKLTFIISG